MSRKKIEKTLREFQATLKTTCDDWGTLKAEEVFTPKPSETPKDKLTDHIKTLETLKENFDTISIAAEDLMEDIDNFYNRLQ